jgi:hypothetical protein
MTVTHRMKSKNLYIAFALLGAAGLAFDMAILHFFGGKKNNG